MKIVRSPIGRCVAIVTIVCAIALGNLATSSGTGCAHFCCSYNTTWYIVPNPGMGRFVVWDRTRGYCAWNCAASGWILAPPGSPTIINGCQVCGTLPCPCLPCCNQVDPPVGSSIQAAETTDVGCKVPR
jgi:hypothetical protein